MTTLVERLISTVLCAAAVSIGVSVVHREFWGQPPIAPGGLNPFAPPAFVPGADTLSSAGIREGRVGARVEILEFADFQCPFCADYEKTLGEVAARYRDSVSIVFIHFPLTGHRYARKAAQTAECANEQGRFAAIKTILYANQDSFDLNRWTSYAKQAGVKNMKAFKDCLGRASESPRINTGVALGKRLNIHGTPTIILNGWQFAGAPPDTALATAIADVLRGKNPRKGTR